MSKIRSAKGSNVLESVIQNEIKDYLKLMKCVIFKKHNVSPKKNWKLSPTDLGIADLIGCTRRGRFIAVEVKKPGGSASPEQIEFLADIKSRGGIAILADDLDQVVQATKGLL